MRGVNKIPLARSVAERAQGLEGFYCLPECSSQPAINIWIVCKKHSSAVRLLEPVLAEVVLLHAMPLVLSECLGTVNAHSV